MRSADEAAFVDAMYGTNLYACAAAGAKIVVDGRKVVLYGDSAVGTGLLALHTADTTVGTELTNNSALIVAGALNENSGLLAYDVDYAVRTSLSAEAAAYALLRINLSDATLGIDNDCILGTNRHTVAIAKTSVGTVTVTCVAAVLGSGTGLDAVVNELSLFGLASAVAGYVSNLLINLACRKAQNFGELSSNVRATGSTEAGIVGLTLAESLCVSVTTGESTSTAVGTGKAITNSCSTLVLFYCKENRGKRKKNCTNYCNYK